MKLNYARPVALSIVALLATASGALALDANDFASKVKAVYGFSLPPGSDITFGAATVSGNDISFAGVSLKMPGADGAGYSIDTQLKFTGVTEQPDGSYVADGLSFPDVDYKLDDGELSVKNIALKHIYVSGSKTPGFIDSSRLFGEASIGPLVLTMDGKPVVTLDSATLSNGFKPSQTESTLTELDSNGSTSGLKFDVSGAKDPEAAAEAKALGLSTVTGKFVEALNWTLSDGHMNMSEISLDLDTVGKLKFALDMTGYTPQFLQSLAAMGQSMGDAAKGGESQQQTAMLLAALQTLFLNSSSFRFDDASITNKLLDMVAKQSGSDRSAFIDQTVATIPAVMNEGDSDQIPKAVVQTVQAAVRAYLTDPKSVEIKLQPKTPLGVLGIAAAAMQPAIAVQQLGLKILVNDKEITEADAAKETGAAPASSSDSSAAPATDDDSTTAPSDDDQNGTSDDSTSTDDSN